jgi:putative membrane protein
VRTNDALKLVLLVLAVLLLGRFLLGVAFATLAVGAHGPAGSLVVLLPVLLAAGGLLALLVVALARGLGDGGEDEALAELRRAYARGDLSDEEYERRRERLTQR